MPIIPLKDTESTQRVYEYLKGYIEREGFPPTHREIAEACYIGTASVNRHLDRLHMLEIIERVEGKNRGLRLTGKPLRL